jgi:hypothetical protein
MATKPSRNGRRQPVRPPEPEYVDDAPGPITYQDDGADETVRSILSQFGDDDVEIKIYKQLPGGGESYWYSATADQIGEEQIRTVNGGFGGKFTLKIYVGGELRRAKVISLADAPGLTVPSGPGGVPGGSDPMMAILLQRLASLETALQRQVPAQREPINDLADAMVKLDALRGASAPKEMPIDTILKCIEIGKSIGGGGTVVDDSFLGVLKDILKEVAPVALPYLMGGGARSPGAPVPQIPAGQPGANDMERAQQVENSLREGIAYLKKKCMMGADPDLYLALICDNADQEQFGQLVHIATTQEFALFAKLDPEIEQPSYAAFFRHIYDGIRSAFNSPNPVDDNRSGSGGNTTDVTSNVRTGEGGNT